MTTAAAATKIQRAWRRAHAIASTNCPITLESAKEIITRGGRVLVICEPEGGHEYIFDHDALAAYCRSSLDLRNVATGREFNRAELLRIDAVLPFLADEKGKEGQEGGPSSSSSSSSSTTIVVNGIVVLFLRTILSVFDHTMQKLANTLNTLATVRNHRGLSHKAVGDAYNQVIGDMIDEHGGSLISIRTLAAPLPEEVLVHIQRQMELTRANLVDQSESYFYRNPDFLRAQDRLSPEDIESFCNYTRTLRIGLAASAASTVSLLWTITTATASQEEEGEESGPSLPPCDCDFCAQDE